MNVLPGEAGYPTTMELTLPSSMTVIPFGSSEAEVVAQHDDGTATWRYQFSSTGGIVYAGDYIREDIQAGGTTIQFYYGRKHQAVMAEAGAADAVKAVSYTHLDVYKRQVPGRGPGGGAELAGSDFERHFSAGPAPLHPLAGG